MLKTALAASIILGSVSFASAMPIASISATGTSLPVVKAAVVVVRKVVRRRPVRRHVVVTKTIIRR